MKTILVPLGVVLMVLGLFGPRLLSQVASNMDAGSLRSVVFVSADLLRASFLAGVACVIIGALRSRKKI